MKFAQMFSGAVLGAVFANAVASTVLPIEELKRYGVADPDSQCVASAELESNVALATKITPLFRELSIRDNTVGMRDSLIQSNTIICLSDMGYGGLYLNHINSLLLNPLEEHNYYNENYEHVKTVVESRSTGEVLSDLIHEGRHKMQIDKGVQVTSLYLAQDKALVGKVMEADAYAYADFVTNGTPMLEGFKAWFSTDIRESYENGYLSNSIDAINRGFIGSVAIDFDLLYSVGELPDGTNYLRDSDVNLLDDVYYGISNANQELWKVVEQVESDALNVQVASKNDANHKPQP